jgi:hypothetical protein
MGYEMNTQQQELAAGRWNQLTFMEQMANIGSEVSRALNWRAKKNHAYSQKVAERALELTDLTLKSGVSFACLLELARMRAVLVDYFFDVNQYRSTVSSWWKYFYYFNFATRQNT